MVFVAPVPDAVTPAPTKSRVVAAVERGTPSSATVRLAPPPPLPPPEMVMVFDEAESAMPEPAWKLTIGLSSALDVFDVMSWTKFGLFGPPSPVVALDEMDVTP